jgi:competence protein ComEC
MVIGVVSAEGMPREKAPRRVRVTTRKTPDLAAGDFVPLKARLLPPSHATLPGGYDFARDAYFAGVGAVGSALGEIAREAPPGDATWRQRFDAAIDQARNRLALRVNAIIGGDEGAIAAAMVTGKRDLLSAINSNNINCLSSLFLSGPHCGPASRSGAAQRQKAQSLDRLG